MKNIIIVFLLGAFLIPSSGLAINKFFKRSGKIETDESGGYSQSQSNYKEKRAKQKQEKMKGGYYEGGYHNKTQEFKPDELQFVDPAGKTSSKKKAKTYKKVQETK